MTQRPIKFRYVYQGNIVDVGAIEFFEDGTFRVNNELVGGTLIESTGLHDKNGKEIWEGDILSPGIREVLWFDEGEYDRGVGYYTRSHELDAYDDIFTLGKTQVDESTVIGNIYENPDLLTQTNT